MYNLGYNLLMIHQVHFLFRPLNGHLRTDRRLKLFKGEAEMDAVMKDVAA